MVPRGLEPRTLRLLAVRSSQLSYETLWGYLICIIERAKTSRAMLGNVHNSSSIEPSQFGGRALSTSTTISAWHLHLPFMDLFCLSRISCTHFCSRSSSAREDQTLWTSIAASKFVSQQRHSKFRHGAMSLSSWQQHRSRATQRKLFHIGLAINQEQTGTHCTQPDVPIMPLNCWMA